VEPRQDLGALFTIADTTIITPERNGFKSETFGSASYGHVVGRISC
jgi:hypothetical protein